MKVVLLVLIIAQAVSARSHHNGIGCYVGKEGKYVLEGGFSYCTTEYSGSTGFSTASGGHELREIPSFFDSHQYSQVKMTCLAKTPEAAKLNCVCFEAGCNLPFTAEEFYADSTTAVMAP